jgi:hypothetical protein
MQKDDAGAFQNCRKECFFLIYKELALYPFRQRGRGNFEQKLIERGGFWQVTISNTPMVRFSHDPGKLVVDFTTKMESK